MARAVLFESAGRWTGPPRRTCAFGAMARSSGPRPSSDDGRDLAVKWSLEWDSLCLCGSADGWVAFAFLASLRFKNGCG